MSKYIIANETEEDIDAHIQKKLALLDKKNDICFNIEHDVKNSKRIGVSMMNFGNVISRIDDYLNIDEYIISNLRRIKSWSTGLQYYDDICRGCI